jgi:hypothetical protein
MIRMRMPGMTRMILGLVGSLLLAAAFARPGVWSSGVPVFAMAFVIAACSTVLILTYVVRASGKARPRWRLAAGPEIPATPEAPEIPGTEDDEHERVVVRESAAPDDDDEFYGVGKGLRGTRGELALAMRLHSGSMGDCSRRRARSACSADATTAERVRAAKKLGIGRGEIDLALRLQKLESHTPGEGKNA